MQDSYLTRAPLSEYDRSTKRKEWEFPKFKDYWGNGYYFRKHVISETDEVIERLLIKRYVKKKKVKGKEVTKSLLPCQLSPYKKYSIKVMAYVMSHWEKTEGKIRDTLDSISFDGVCDEINDTIEQQIYYIKKTFDLGRKKYLVWKKLNRTYSLESFIQLCSRHNYCHAETLSMSYYAGNGGYISNSQFLFGTASQFRRSKL